MGREKRGNSTYYYTAQRVGGRVVKCYVGTGHVAELAAQLDDLKQDEREQAADVVKRERAAIADLDAPLAELNELANLLARAVLVAAGYTQHHRGEWRKKRA